MKHRYTARKIIYHHGEHNGTSVTSKIYILRLNGFEFVFVPDDGFSADARTDQFCPK